jgi:hypothetical protein
MRIGIHPGDSGPRPKILFPYLQRATVSHAKFNHVNIRAAKPREVPAINLKTMFPFVNQSAGIFREVFFQIIYDSIPSRCPPMILSSGY